jgi:hypothetical protein
METTFKERISNVISWAGFLCLVPSPISLFVGYVVGGKDRALAEFLIVFAIFGMGVWIVVGVVNYLLCGNLRLIPWEEKEGN